MQVVRCCSFDDAMSWSKCETAPASHYARSRLTAMARLTAALCLSCASAMSYHNPVKAPQRTGTSFLPVKLQSGNSKETNKNSSHERIAREARSATL